MSPKAALPSSGFSAGGGGRIDAPLNPRPPDDRARPGCTAVQTGFSGVRGGGGEGEGYGTLIAAIKNADRCGGSTTDPPSSLTFAKSYIAAR